MSGSVAQWATAFRATPQFEGSSWSMAYNQVQQTGRHAIYDSGEAVDRDVRLSLAWLKAYGVAAVAVSGPKSQEFWKPFAHPAKFEGVLPVLWQSGDLTIYSVPQRTTGLAHVLPVNGVVMHTPAHSGDIAEIEKYVAALDDPRWPVAQMNWTEQNRIRIHAAAPVGQAISLQVSYHGGWHANVNSRKVAIKPDGLGLMWFEPGCSEPCDVDLHYDGGLELSICRLVSYVAIAGLFALPLGFLARRLRDASV